MTDATNNPAVYRAVIMMPRLLDLLNLTVNAIMGDDDPDVIANTAAAIVEEVMPILASADFSVAWNAGFAAAYEVPATKTIDSWLKGTL